MYRLTAVIVWRGVTCPALRCAPLQSCCRAFCELIDAATINENNIVTIKPLHIYDITWNLCHCGYTFTKSEPFNRVMLHWGDKKSSLGYIYLAPPSFCPANCRTVAFWRKLPEVLSGYKMCYFWNKFVWNLVLRNVSFKFVKNVLGESTHWCIGLLNCSLRCTYNCNTNTVDKFTWEIQFRKM